MTSKEAVIAAIDILLVAYLFYRIFMLVRGTRAWRILVGIIIYIVVMSTSKRLGLHTLYWLLETGTTLGPVALVILFFPEMRQFIEGLGRLDRWTPRLAGAGENEERIGARTVEEIVGAVTELATARIGALVVIEKSGSLGEIASNGVQLDAKVSTPLLVSIFYEGNPLHDGAVIIRGDSIAAAACRLPLSDSVRLDKVLHMRHRAAVGVTESNDCIAVVVSEERGGISVASEGRLRQQIGPNELREVLNRELRNHGSREERARKIREKREQRRAAVSSGGNRRAR